MGIVDSMKDFFGAKGRDDFEDYEEDYEEEYEDEEEEPRFSRNFYQRRSEKVVDINSAPRQSYSPARAADITIMKIHKIADAEAVAEVLKQGRPVIFDVLDMEKTEDAARVVDFVGGVVCGVNGNHKRVSGGIFIATPQNMTINIEENPHRVKSSSFNMSAN